MKIKFIVAPKGRNYKVGEVVDFKGAVEETYAMKYISREWAEPYDESAIKAADKAARDAQAKVDADAKTDADARAKAESEAKVKEADAKAKASQASQSGGANDRK